MNFRSWLRRMAVKKAYRRRGIAMRLLDEVIEFCTERCHEGIELITTECHYKVFKFVHFPLRILIGLVVS